MLASLFVGKALVFEIPSDSKVDSKKEKLLFYDIPAYFFAHWVYNDKNIPYDRINSIYGEFLWHVEIQRVLEEQIS